MDQARALMALGRYDKAEKLVLTCLDGTANNARLRYRLATIHLCLRDFDRAMGQAYYESGDLEKAAESFEEITELTTGRLFHGHLYARSFFFLGKIYERLGQPDEAQANYSRFLLIWKNADPGIPEVEEAQSSQNRLRARDH